MELEKAPGKYYYKVELTDTSVEYVYGDSCVSDHVGNLVFATERYPTSPTMIAAGQWRAVYPGSLNDGRALTKD
jgi:hypothetical protein